MRKLVFLLMVVATGLNAQDGIKTFRHEIKINTLNLLLGNPDLSYEYLPDSRSGVGFFANINVDKNRLWDYDYMLGPYYRFYTGKKHASGFFIEGGVVVFGERVVTGYYYDPETFTGHDIYVKEIGFGPSLAIGGKLIISEATVFEFFGGLGRNFRGTEHGSDIFSRFGISFGKRF